MRVLSVYAAVIMAAVAVTGEDVVTCGGFVKASSAVEHLGAARQRAARRFGAARKLIVWDLWNKRKMTRICTNPSHHHSERQAGLQRGRDAPVHKGRASEPMANSPELFALFWKNWGNLKRFRKI